MADPAARAVVSDDGSTIWLTAYTAAGEAVPVALQPARAVALAGELIEAAVPKLNPVKARGGDPYSDPEMPKSGHWLRWSLQASPSNNRRAT